MGTAVERSAEVAGEGTDVGALRAADAEVDVRQLEAGDLELVNSNVLGGEGGLVTAAGDEVGALALVFHGGEHRRHLLDVARERSDGLLGHLAGDMLVRVSGVDGLLQVETRGRRAHAEGARVGLLLRLQGVHLLGHLAHADNQQPRGQWVQRAGMAHLHVVTGNFRRHLAHLAHHIERGAVVRLVNQQKITLRVDFQPGKVKGDVLELQLVFHKLRMMARMPIITQ